MSRFFLKNICEKKMQMKQRFATWNLEKSELEGEFNFIVTFCYLEI